MFRTAIRASKLVARRIGLATYIRNSNILRLLRGGEIHISHNQSWKKRYSLSGSQTFKIEAPAFSDDPAHEKGAIIVAKFFNASGALLRPPYSGWSKSANFDAFTYLPVHSNEALKNIDEHTGRKMLTSPEQAQSVELEVRIWKSAKRVRLPKGVRVDGLEGENRRASVDSNNGFSKKFIYEQRLVSISPVLISIHFRPQQRRVEKGAVILVEYYDESRNLIPPPYPGLAISDIGAYQYLNIPAKVDKFLDNYSLLKPPEDAEFVRVEIKPWKNQKELELLRSPVFSIGSKEKFDALLIDRADDIQFASCYAEFAHWSGDIAARRKALETILSFKDDKGTYLKLAHLNGVMEELDLNWLPKIPGPREPVQVASRNRIFHLMKVCMPHENTGGAVRNYNTIRCQVECGLDPYIATPLGYPRNMGKPSDHIFSMTAGAPHFHLDIGDSNTHAWPPARATHFETLLLAGLVRQRGASLIHAASGYRGYDNALKGLALKHHFGIPLIYEVRSLHEHTWGPARTDIINASLSQMRMAQENRCMAEADHIVTIAEAMKNVLIDRGVPENKITVVPNAVDNTFLEPSNGKKANKLRQELGYENTKVIGYISNLSTREGHSVLLRAFAKLFANNSDLRCLIVGEGPARPKLEKLATDLGIALGVTFTGNVPHDDIKAYYEVIDIFVTPRVADYASDYVTPMKPFEALALARPLIMSDRPVSKEIIGNDERGLSFQTGDADHLTKKIETLLQKPSLGQKLAEKGRTWVKEERNWTKNAKIYKSLYSTLTNK